ncbi:hypothetical protein [Acidianus sp. HS-5]|uniref:hypothetical protein n=1 Tax=Acidianus sp. HS-5 TaxID=2886040 RepID=UPI001F2AF17A|nr:hypothetical protein [Acidianus sp. HS-5]BDC17470.1 hypothetical protein HS5_03600 [Acidianus sp. HS-5]
MDLAFAEIAWKRIVLFGDNKEVILKQLSNAISFIENTCDVISLKDLMADAGNK